MDDYSPIVNTLNSLFQTEYPKYHDGGNYIESESEALFGKGIATKLYLNHGVVITKTVHSSEIREWEHDLEGYRFWIEPIEELEW